MKRKHYDSPRVDLYEETLESRILSNVERITTVGGNGWDDEEYDY